MSNEIYSELSIIIPTFYPGPIIHKCIDSLPYKSDIIIVDNGDDDELKKIISKKKIILDILKLEMWVYQNLSISLLKKHIMKIF